MDFNRDCSYIRAMSPHMGPTSSPRPDITMVQDGNQGVHLSLLLLSSTLQLLIFREKTKHSVSLSPTPHHSLAHHNSSCLPGCCRLQVGLCFLCGAWGRSSQVCVWVSLACSGRHSAAGVVVVLEPSCLSLEIPGCIWLSPTHTSRMAWGRAVVGLP